MRSAIFCCSTIFLIRSVSQHCNNSRTGCEWYALSRSKNWFSSIFVFQINRLHMTAALFVCTISRRNYWKIKVFHCDKLFFMDTLPRSPFYLWSYISQILCVNRLPSKFFMLPATSIIAVVMIPGSQGQ